MSKMELLVYKSKSILIKAIHTQCPALEKLTYFPNDQHQRVIHSFSLVNFISQIVSIRKAHCMSCINEIFVADFKNHKILVKHKLPQEQSHQHQLHLCIMVEVII